MNEKNLEDLLVAAAEDSSVKVLENLLQALRAVGDLSAADTVEKVDFLLESWEDHLDAAQAAFCLELFGLNIPDSAVHRRALSAALKTLLPPYLNKSGFLRALGLRDQAVPVRDVIRRFHNLLQLKNNLIVFIPENSRWCIINNIDALNGSVAVSSIGGTGATSAIPLQNLLNDARLFLPGPEILKIADGNRKPSFSGQDYRNIVAAKALTRLSPEDVRKMALATFTPQAMSSEEFKNWYESAKPAAGGSAERRSCEGRSLKEMGIILAQELAAPKPPAIEADDLAHFKQFFDNLRPAIITREVDLLADVLVKLADRLDKEQLRQVLSSLPAKTIFWPADPLTAPLEQFAIFGDLNVKMLTKLFEVGLAILPEEYLVRCAVRLPLRSLNVLCEQLSDAALQEVFKTPGAGSGSDLLLWVWKNRKKRSAPFLGLVNIQTVIRALNQGKLPKAWGAAQRDLKTQLLDKADFQQQLVDEADGNVKVITGALQGALFFSPGERQSMLVKFARLSKDILKHLESGVGQKMLAADKKEEKSSQNEMLYTSLRSHQRLLQELDDIINIHMPENRESLKAARAHGDFRENSEFDAAKERRNFLSRRRTELERDLSRVQGVNFRNVTVEDIAVIGCTVTLQFPDGGEEKYYLLGAWDGDPDKHYLSYKTRLGEAIYGHDAGSKLHLPGDRECRLLKVEPLPEEVLAEME